MALSPERSPNAPTALAVVAPPDDPLQLKRNSAGGNYQKKAKGVSGGASGRVRPQALGLSFTDFHGNGFGFRRKIPPERTIGDGRTILASFCYNILHEDKKESFRST